MRTMPTGLEQNLPHRVTALQPRISSVTAHILVRHQLVRFGVDVEPRDGRGKHGRIVQHSSRQRDHRFESEYGNGDVEEAEREVDEQGSEVLGDWSFGQGEAHGVDGALVGGFARAAVEDDGVEGVAAVFGGKARRELDCALGAAVGEDMEQDRWMVFFVDAGCHDVTRQP